MVLPTSWPSSLWAESRQSFDFASVDTTRTFDVAIVGAGYTGLWTAIHLKDMRPDLNVIIVDVVGPGFGASGRNGGWCSGLFPIDIDSLAERHGVTSAIEMQRAAIAAVDDVGRYVESHGIDCDWAKSGTLTVATNPAQEHRLRDAIGRQQRHGFGDDDLRWIDPEELASRVVIDRARGALFSPHCAVVHPMKLTNGLVRRCIELEVEMVPGYRADAIDERGVIGCLENQPTRIGATWVVRATEGYTPHLRGESRAVIPLYSYMVATEPLDDDVWREIGWSDRETLAEGRHMVTYAQRTADGRIAFGGRGAGYRYSSRVSEKFDTHPSVKRRITSTVRRLFPATRDARITHHWGGPLAVPRDWHPAVTVDASMRRITAGGYVGDGVALSHLAGRTVAAAICGVDSPDTRLAFARHVNQRWEPEPLRWLGVNAGLRLPSLADAVEERTGRPARRLGAAMERLFG